MEAIGLSISFWVLAVLTVAGALGVVLLQNVFRSALALVLCFVMIAGIYITLSADFLAAVQILVYVGAISVLIILSIMMTHDIRHGSPANRLKVPAIFVAVIMLGVLYLTITHTSWGAKSAQAPLAPTTEALAGKLFGANGFVLPVEIAALLLLAAVVGAIVLARDK